MNTGTTNYVFIDRNLVSEIYELLKINPIRLTKPKKLRDYNNQIAKKPITEALYPNLVFLDHKKLIASMLITDLKQHATILNKLWINKFEILLNINNDTIIFPNQLLKTNPKSIFSINFKSKSPLEIRIVEPSTSKTLKILFRLKFSQKNEQYIIHNIETKTFDLLTRGIRRNKIEIFAFSIKNIDNQLIFHKKTQLNVINLSSMKIASQNFEKIKTKLLSEYHKFFDIFDRAQTNKLPPHRSYNHKIELSKNRFFF